MMRNRLLKPTVRTEKHGPRVEDIENKRNALLPLSVL